MICILFSWKKIRALCDECWGVGAGSWSTHEPEEGGGTYNPLPPAFIANLLFLGGDLDSRVCPYSYMYISRVFFSLEWMLFVQYLFIGGVWLNSDVKIETLRFNYNPSKSFFKKGYKCHTTETKHSFCSLIPWKILWSNGLMHLAPLRIYFINI